MVIALRSFRNSFEEGATLDLEIEKDPVLRVGFFSILG